MNYFTNYIWNLGIMDYGATATIYTCIVFVDFFDGHQKNKDYVYLVYIVVNWICL